MKLRTLFLLAILSSAPSLPVYSQQVAVTGRKQIYTRPKPITGFKKTFSIRRPIAKAATPALSRKITAEIDPVKVLDIRLQEELNESQWLSESDFEVVFNDSGMLTVMLWMEGSAAYSDGVTKYAVVDVEKGKRVTPADVFADFDGLIALVKKKQDAEVAEAIKTIKANPDFADGDPKQLFEYTDFKAEDLNNFAADMAGVAFFYDYGFPNVLKALEPEGELRLSWAEIKPFIRKDGLLARFVP
jgi:hypothetical protein